MISVIIPVKNNRNIEECLNALAKIPKPTEVEVIVIDASTISIDDIKNKYKNINWIYYRNKNNKKYTVAEQRNLGIKKSKGKYIAFLDSDCIPDTNWLIELFNPIIKENEMYVTGKVKSHEGLSLHDSFWEKMESEKYRNYAGAANTIFNKLVISKIGYFDESFEAGEDMDFTWRVTNAGFKIRYNPKAIIYDDWGNFKQEIKRSIRYGAAITKLFFKHKDKVKSFIFEDSRILIYPIFIICFPISFFFIYYPSLLLIPILKNINNNPFKNIIINLVYGYGILSELFRIVTKRSLVYLKESI